MRKFLDRLFGRGKQRQNAVHRRNLLAGVERMEDRRVMTGGMYISANSDASEGGGVVSGFYVSWWGDAAGTVPLTFSGSATQGASDDYTVSATGSATLSGTTLTLSSSSGVAYIRITPVDDANVEGTETITATLGTPSNGNTVSPGSATVRLYDNEGSGSAAASSSGTAGYFDIGDPVASVTEGGTISFPVTFHLSPGASLPTGCTVTVSAVEWDQTALPTGTSKARLQYNDFDATTTTLTFSGADGQTQNFVVQTNQDQTVEWTEVFHAQITATFNNWSAATIGGVGDKGAGTIGDDDIADAVVTFPLIPNSGGCDGGIEGNQANPGRASANIAFVDPNTGSPVTVEMPGLVISWSTADGTAIAGTDYIANNSSYTLWVPATGVSNIATFNFVGNDTIEDLTEYFNTNWSTSSAKIWVYPSQNDVVIMDDDTAYVQFTSATLSVTEGGAIQGQVMFVGKSDIGGCTVDIWTNAGTASATDYDYNPIPNPAHLTFSGALNETLSFTIQTIADDWVEAQSETFTIVLGNPATSAAIGSRVGRGPTSSTVATINDNDQAVLSVQDASVEEDGTYGNVYTGMTLTFLFTLSHPVDVPVTVNFTLSSNGNPNFVFGTGNGPGDISEFSGVTYSVTFAAGDMQAEWDAHTAYDTTPEDSETFQLSILSWTPMFPTRNVIGGDRNAIGTITDEHD